nr:26S proteasome non-ATPase regulatory subunit 4 homolog [Ipomoea batatas]
MSMDDSTTNITIRDADMPEAASEDQDLALALQLSVQDSTKDQATPTDMSKLLADQSFVSSILASLPGVDPNDPSVKDLLASMQGQSEVHKLININWDQRALHVGGSYVLIKRTADNECRHVAVTVIPPSPSGR